MELSEARERMIVALDFPSAAAALEHVSRLDNRPLWFKVGLQLYLAGGRAVVDALVGDGYKVFLDLKLHDIPNTVAGAVRSLADSGASLVTVHAGGGAVMLAAAAEAAAMAPGGPKLLAVTVLTSMDHEQLRGVGIENTLGAQVLRLARMAVENGISGLVCSAEEVTPIRFELGQEPMLVVPGIRSRGAAIGDQKRVATPGDAMRAGASKLVIGRPITHAVDPSAACEAILAEMMG